VIKKLLFLAAGAALASCAARGKPAPPAVERGVITIARADALFSSKRYGKALTAYLELRRASARNPYLIASCGYARLGLGQYARSLTDFTAALELSPRNPLLHLARGSAYYGLHHYEKAVRDYTDAIRFFQKGDEAHKAEAYYGRGCSLHRRGDYHGAISDFSAALLLKPDTDDYEAALSEAYKKYEENKKKSGIKASKKEKRTKAATP